MLYLGVGVHFLNHAPDDVYITLRYAKNIAEGHGPVYNVGERVEGFSNPLWLALTALLHPLLQAPRAMTLAVKLMGFVAGLLALLLIAALARRDTEASELWGLPPLLVGLSGYLAYWAVSGMETGLHLLLVVLAVGGYIRALESGRKSWRLLCGLLFALLALSRPEGPVFFVAALVARGLLLWRDGKRPDWADAGFFATAIVPVMIYFFWRHSYYGAWWPNTFYAKAGGGLSTWADGVRYLLRALGPAFWSNALLMPLIFIGLLPWKKATPRTVVLLTAIAAQAGFIVLGGGDWMPGWRFVLPAVPLLALLAPSIATRLFAAMHKNRLDAWLGGWRKTAALLLLLAPLVAHLYGVKQLSHQPSGWTGYHDEYFFVPHHKAVADWLADHAEPGEWLATGEAGLIPYLTGLPAIDCFGLTDAHLARVPGKRHEKVDPDYILDRRPQFLVIGGITSGNQGVSSDFAYGRSLLEHPRMKAEYTPSLRYGSFLVLERAPNPVSSE